MRTNVILIVLNNFQLSSYSNKSSWTQFFDQKKKNLVTEAPALYSYQLYNLFNDETLYWYTCFSAK